MYDHFCALFPYQKGHAIVADKLAKLAFTYNNNLHWI